MTAISDLHGQFPKVPECDLLIIAGDICPDVFPAGRRRPDYAKLNPERQKQWFEAGFLPWLSKRSVGGVILTWGNHDFCGHLYPSGVTKLGPPESQIWLVVDDWIDIHGTKIWLTPWSNQFMDWAFMKPHEELGAIYSLIDEGTDIIVSHQPPYGCGDVYPNPVEIEHIGSSELLYHIERVQPKKVICGHLHDGHGRYQIGDTEVLNVAVLDDNYNLSYSSTTFDI